MAILDAPPTEVVEGDRTDWRAWLACGLAALSAASAAVALVLPFYAAGLPARETLYLYEIDQQWPYTSAAGPLVGLLALWALAMAPFMSVAVASWSAYRLWTTRFASSGRVALLVALLLSGATLGWFTTPLAGDLVAWMID